MNMNHILHRAELLPNVSTFEAEQRLHHRDLSTLTDEQIGAELHLLTTAHAQLVLRRRLVYLDVCSADGRPIAAIEWTRERLDRLRCEQQRRRRKVRAA